MVYQGSKNRIAKDIIPLIQHYIDAYNISTYIEPFVGGANVIDKIHCVHKYGYDINDNLICLLNYCKENPNLDIAPDICTFEHYKDVRSNQASGKYSKEYVALIGYCASYGGRYYDGGYGRDKTGKRNIYLERVINLKEQAPLFTNITFECKSYEDIDTSLYKNCVFYLDPPYKSTKPYAVQSIDYEHFYNFCRELGNNNIVFISEYSMPDDFKCIWQKEVKTMQKSDRVTGQTATEKLFMYTKLF